MSVIAYKIKDMFSDLWLNVELFFGKMVHKNDVDLSVEPAVPDAPVEITHKIDEQKHTSIKLSFSMRMLRMSSKDLLRFYDELATMVESGVTLIDSLSIIQAQTKNKGYKKLYIEMIHHINSGMSLADVMYLFPHIFPSMQSALVEAGEKSGNLGVVLEELAVEMEDGQDFLRKITGAMFYPVIVMLIAFTMVAGMMIFVIPKIAAMYDDANVTLPALTQAVIDISDFVSTQWQLLLISIFGGSFMFVLLFTKTRIGKLTWENIVSIIPMVGKLSREKNLMIIATNLAMLLKSGVLIAEAFEITEKTVGNLHYRKELSHVRHGIIMGRSISEMMGLEDIKNQKFKRNKYFPLQFSQLMHIGETTGTIDKMLFKLKKNYHKSIDYKLKNISTMVEPLMIFFVAAIVGAILLAVMLPFFYIGTTIS